MSNFGLPLSSISYTQVGDSSWTGGPLSIVNGGTGATSESGARTNLDVYSTGQVTSAISTALIPYATTSYVAANFQPLDADLTALATLSTTSYGRSFNTLVDAAAARVYIGAGTGSGTVTSVGLSSTDFTVSGSPVTSSGSITANLATQAGITAGSYGSASNSLAATVNSKGVLTALTSQAIAIGWSQITSGKPTTLSGYGITDGITSAAVAAGYQPLDSDLTSIATLTTTTYGRGLLTTASATALAGSLSVSDFTTGTLPTGLTAALTGDITKVAGSNPTVLATVNSNVGTFGDSTHVGSFVINAKGLTTGASSVLITPAWSSITSTPTTISGYGITDSNPAYTGDVTKPLNSTVTTMATTQSAVHTWSATQTFTVAPVFTATSATRTALGLVTVASSGLASDLTGTLAAAQTPAYTGDITKASGSGVTVLATTQPAVHTWSLAQTFTVAPVFTDLSGSRIALGLGTLATQSGTFSLSGLKAQMAGVAAFTGSDATATVAPGGANNPTVFFTTALTANRILNLSNTNAYDGLEYDVIFTGTGGFTLTVRDATATTNSKALIANQGCKFVYSSAAGAWKLKMFWSL